MREGGTGLRLAGGLRYPGGWGPGRLFCAVQVWGNGAAFEALMVCLWLKLVAVWTTMW